MDKVNISRKDVFTINCREIPETIFVETRFLTLAAAKQKKYDKLHYLITKNGKMELFNNEQQFMAIRNCRSLVKPTTISVSLNQSAPAVPQASAFQQSLINSIVPTLPALQSHTPTSATTVQTVPINIPSVVTTVQNFPMIRPVPIAQLSNNTNAMPNMASLPTMAAIPTTTATQISQIPVIDITARTAQVTKPYEPPVIYAKPALNNAMQQTDISALNMKSVGIQCHLAEEIEDLDINWPEPVVGAPLDSMEDDNFENEKATFLKFVQENSTQYKNFKECLICGEICKTNKYFYTHMAVHRGPNVLCFKCGFSFNNEDLLRKHNCLKTKLANRINLKCPHYRCRVTAISKLELYDHMNEHDNYRPYKCNGCTKAFFTRQEFLRHILIRAKCYTQAKPKRYCIYNLERQRDRLCRVRVFTLHSFKKRTILVTVFLSRRTPKQGLCKICMRSIGNAGVFRSHHVKCVLKFRKRLMRKRYGIKAI